jgi:hypothetical protein
MRQCVLRFGVLAFPVIGAIAAMTRQVSSEAAAAGAMPEHLLNITP